MKFLRIVRALFAWRTVKRGPHWACQQNTLTGERRVLRVKGDTGGYSAVPAGWLAGDES